MTDAISSILSQIRAHEMRAGGALADSPAGNAINPTNPGLPGAGRVDPGKAPGFAETLNNAIDSVSSAQAKSGALQQAFEMGDPRADLARVMVAMQQSSVAFKATVEVRNRMVQAYQDVMNMPV
ncbi:flagellar hook-basal body complex protein FliE [Novilysobacter spongiicola]|uniref:Flagellar hook-basal body complex protein FliE n=1 Tax=Lysobacter spongiicola DSM 21749 TaxID=1122188 RepID=A0A1T4S073_9GAMM|nr:flagellar hook-basal body complex protein FliE [Lysobacter spongiicola]SKA21644.1 flagellar hook-basal body complex protein FliE [Lysobacter spongiicola DSM 21749]